MSETLVDTRKEETERMKAIVHDRYGDPDVLELREVEKPVPDEVRGVLVKIFASSVNPADRYDVRPPFVFRLIGPLFRMGVGFRGPKEHGMGSDAAGQVEAVHSSITQFKPGDEVFGAVRNGYAEYGVAREDRLAQKPRNVTFEEAAAVPIAAITALQALRDHGSIKPGHKVLVNGAGGGVGAYAVQIAKALGAEVTAVTSTGNLELVRSLGADHVIDYTKEDFTKNGEHYDLVCDIAASHSISDYKQIMSANSTFVLVGLKGKVGIGRLLYYLVGGRLGMRGDKRFRFFVAKINSKDLAFLGELLETKRLVSVIGGRFHLNETPEAIRHLIRGIAQGKIVINIRQS